ncbi:hypothetical protein B0T26DRAFT_217387 [Lasiosphaeria miniovina]|uniref:Uncharacterized protein n=1 Tax=Lasiosphaeria miniovina TaxID=1954250 RepID=A0AA40E0E3_9PEZI|nr:uncharacterized protein B0T26DRAFT_217387 [Lasiosphaeria miniovina]KAK0722390.1 hypothetical protein B0T26DRAFT_217387 [Lasiosphaeria miniovina]
MGTYLVLAIPRMAIPKIDGSSLYSQSGGFEHETLKRLLKGWIVTVPETASTAMNSSAGAAKSRQSSPSADLSSESLREACTSIAPYTAIFFHLFVIFPTLLTEGQEAVLCACRLPSREILMLGCLAGDFCRGLNQEGVACHVILVDRFRRGACDSTYRPGNFLSKPDLKFADIQNGQPPLPLSLGASPPTGLCQKDQIHLRSTLAPSVAPLVFPPLLGNLPSGHAWRRRHEPFLAWWATCTHCMARFRETGRAACHGQKEHTPPSANQLRAHAVRPLQCLPSRCSSDERRCLDAFPPVTAN